MQAYYDVVEFATALKPTLLLYLLRDSNKTVSYIDPDVYMFSQLSRAQEIGEESGLVITPHRVTGMPFYPTSPKELNFFRVGIYNLGFICVGKKATSVLQWWEKRLRWHATQFDALPYFTDQRWADFFPTFAQCKILTHKGYNLAFWNIDERPLSIKNSKFLAGDEELVFVHFSQMSSELMKYGRSSLWGTWLSGFSYSAESLANINNLSRIYSGKLIQNAEEVDAMKLEPKFRFTVGRRFARSKMIQRDIDGQRFFKYWGLPLSLTAPKLVSFFEKSNALSGFRVGLTKDLTRIHKRIKGN
jgi:hypothetical protein